MFFSDEWSVSPRNTPQSETDRWVLLLLIVITVRVQQSNQLIVIFVVSRHLWWVKLFTDQGLTDDISGALAIPISLELWRLLSFCKKCWWIMFENRNLASHGDNLAPHTNCGVGINKLWHVTPPPRCHIWFWGGTARKLTLLHPHLGRGSWYQEDIIDVTMILKLNREDCYFI